MASGKRTRSAAGLVTGIALSILVAALYWSGALTTLELKSYDLRFLVRGPEEPHEDVILVTIDPTTVADLGRKTTAIQRREHAQVVAELIGQGVDLVVYDMDFSSPSSFGDEDDFWLQQVIAENPGKVVMSSYVAQNKWVRPNPLFRKAQVSAGQWEYHGRADEQGVLQVSWEGDELSEGYAVFASADYITDPYAEEVTELPPVEQGTTSLELSGLQPGATHHFLIVGHMETNLLAREGAINYVEDLDDRIRRVPLLVSVPGDDRVIETLSMAAAIARLWPDAEFNECSISDTELCLQGGGKRLEAPMVEGNLLINYAGSRGTFPGISFSKLTPEFLNQDKLPGFKNKIAMIGNTHPAAHDEFPTPFTRPGRGQSTRFGYTPGLEIHANALGTILSRDFISKQPDWQAIALVLALGIVLTVIWLFVRAFSVPGVVALMVALVGTGALSQYMFEAENYWLITSPLLMVTGLNFIGVMVVQSLAEYREKLYIKNAFGMYLAPAVIEQLIKDPSRLNLGGEERHMTAIFSDVQNFSSISEKLKPQELVHLLNDYLTPMCDIIFEHEGTVDKFEGDAIIAFFGAPIPHKNHALRACMAALHMQRANMELNRRLESEGMPKLITRMGVNTGPMVVGNMGSAQRMDYTVMGDAVNLAARLEVANKQYGTLVMMSEDTYKEVKDRVEARELDLITVVGKEKPVRVFELMAEKGGLEQSTKNAVQEFAAGLTAYRAKEWDSAIERFEEAIKLRGKDIPSRIYIERCKELKVNPPPPDWDGVMRMKTK